jgi:type II secretory pathway pseudopilin PulG
MQYTGKDRECKADGEAGYVLLAVIFLTVVMLISLAVAAPKIATEIQRDRDVETIHRGEQYKRAIQLYYRTFGAYPTSFDQLKQTNNIRFLRKEYADPLTGKVDWKPVYYGQAHVRPLGFFGQPLSGVAGVGAASVMMGGSSAGMYAISSTTTTDENGIPVAGDSGSGSGASSGPGMSGGTDSGFGSGSGSNSGFGSGSNSGFGSSGSSGSSGLSGLQSSGGLGQSGSGFGSSGSGLSGLQSSGSTTPGGSSGFGSSNSTTASGLSGTTFGGGGPIVGVTLAVNKPSLVDYKLQTRYNKWEFNYDPMEDQMMAASSMFGGTSIDANSTGTGTNTLGTGSGTGNGSFGNSNSGFGNNSGFGSGNNGLGGSNPGGSNGNGGTTPPTGSSNPQ